jgi:hypothetical protein
VESIVEKENAERQNEVVQEGVIRRRDDADLKGGHDHGTR